MIDIDVVCTFPNYVYNTNSISLDLPVSSLQTIATGTHSSYTAHLVYCDRGLGRVSLQSYKPPLRKIKMRFNGVLTCQVYTRDVEISP